MKNQFNMSVGVWEKYCPNLLKQQKVTTSEPLNFSPWSQPMFLLPHLRLKFLPQNIQSLYVLLSSNVLVKVDLKLSMPTSLLEILK